ncbi:DNA ligase 4-like isoform X1 [Trichoplusia ni]|uniref:DNA ligase 4 n=1 Tax=Trichoplusia ni TaxID=7111 RepID=A0A7E5WER3_TRINI|nr:DNA ligase 4-like isoform X1 [Trichoplusia ni]XP_026739180.1 DNA ligase 4-like isoform X1 [Trichoplusia ni]
MANEVPANEIKFEKLCNLFEQLHKKKRPKQEQDKILSNFFNEFKTNTSKIAGIKNASFYPILRLLLPEDDRERNAYNLAESKLGVLLVKVLSLCKNSRDAQKLLNHRSVSTSQDNDFAGVASLVLKSRLTSVASNFTVGDINSILDKIANAEVGKKASVYDDIFSHVIKETNSIQLKWFLRLILKDLKIGMGRNRILALFHPDAPEHYEKFSLLSKLCEEIDDDEARSKSLGIQMYLAVNPMLSERLNVRDVAKQLSANKTYQIEDKFDGERFQIHMENGRFEYFSRRGFCFTSTYGSTYDSGLLTPFLKDCFKSNVSSFILDGEMMGWHKKNQCFGSKGMSFDVKKITDNSKFRPCFCAFDILYYNGKSLVGSPEKGGLPLNERLRILDDLFVNVTGVIQHSKRQIVRHGQLLTDILDALNKAIENQDEGIVVKDIESYYFPNRRNMGWYKVKPEYTEGTMTDLDLVIIGADEAENKRQGRAKSFLVACADGGEPGQMPERWVSVGRVSIGLSFDERERICTALERSWTPYKQKPAPPHLVFNKEKPDFWVLPEDSIVLTVRASELIRSVGFGTDYTLRFPRVEQVREDKPIQDIMKLNEFNELSANKGAVVKLSTNQINGDLIGEVKPRAKRKAQAPQVPEQFLVTSHGDVEVTSKALMGRKICILSEDEDCKRPELGRIVESHGGKVVANRGPDTWCCIAGRMTKHVRAIVESGTTDVISTAWLRSLPASDTLVSHSPMDMLALKPKTRLELAKDYDAFGDKYKEMIDENTLRRCFEKMEKDIQVRLTRKEMLALDKELFGKNNPHSFLRPCSIHMIDQNSLSAILAKMYGAAVYDLPFVFCTHIVVPNTTDKEIIEDLKMKYELKDSVLIVSEDWLEACFTRMELVLETPFLVQTS